MIAYLSGTVLEKEHNALIVLTNKIGYRVFVPLRILERTTQHQEIQLLIHHDSREGMNDLYGFVSTSDRDVFELLLTVSRIGPKSALDILHHADGDAVRSAIQTGDADNLRAVTRIGVKTAKRIVQELESKVGTLPGTAPGSSMPLLSALMNLGYRESEALEALKHIDTSRSEQDQLKQALQYLGTSA